MQKHVELIFVNKNNRTGIIYFGAPQEVSPVYKGPEKRITYTLIVSNPGNSALTDVALYDSIPWAFAIKHIPPEETAVCLRMRPRTTAFFIGRLDPGEAYAVTFILIVCAGTCCGMAAAEFMDTACACGCSGKTMVSAAIGPWTVAMNCKCLCECVRERFSADDFCCLRDYSVYHTGVSGFNTKFGYLVSSGYSITVRYADCNAQEKTNVLRTAYCFFCRTEAPLLQYGFQT